jgi:hypothetical protein
MCIFTLFHTLLAKARLAHNFFRYVETPFCLFHLQFTNRRLVLKEENSKKDARTYTNDVFPSYVSLIFTILKLYTAGRNCPGSKH